MSASSSTGWPASSTLITACSRSRGSSLRAAVATTTPTMRLGPNGTSTRQPGTAVAPPAGGR